MNNTKNISIKQFLEERGFQPAKDRGYYGLYHSPLREDTTPSFKVDYEKNLWYDFGLGEGGSIVDLVMRLENCTLAEAFQRLEDSSFSFHRADHRLVYPTPEQKSAITIREAKPLSHLTLLDYMKGRCVDIDITKRYCSEVHYSVAGKSYFAVGFQNDIKGWELRSRDFQGTVSPKDITSFNNNSDTIMVFEGFIDFLSYLSMKQNPSPTIDTAILNSVSNLNRAIPILESYRTIHLFLDNDDSGRKTTEQIQRSFPNSEVVDHSSFYKNHKDLNDYWCEKCKQKPVLKIQPKKKGFGRKM